MTRLADEYIFAPPASLFLSLMLPHKGQPFPSERRNCSHTSRGVLHFRLPSALQRYNTLDFPRKIVCQQGCYSPLLETQSQRSYAPLDTPSFSLKWYPHVKAAFSHVQLFFENVTAHALHFCRNFTKFSNCAVM